MDGPKSQHGAGVDQHIDLDLAALTVDEVAVLLRVSKSSVERAIAAGSLPSFRFGGLRRVPLAALRQLQSGGQTPAR